MVASKAALLLFASNVKIHYVSKKKNGSGLAFGVLLNFSKG